MWLSRAQVEDLQTSLEFELVKIPAGGMIYSAVMAGTSPAMTVF